MKDQPADTLGAEITRLRGKAGVTLRKFAVEVGISAAYLSDIEHDRRRPSADVLERIVERLRHVGATHEGVDRLNTRLERDLQQWVSETPAVRQMLRQVKESGRDPREVLRDLEKAATKLKE